MDSSPKLLRLDPSAESTSADRVGFLNPPDGAPVYYGFPIVEETRIDDWVFGTITEYLDPVGCDFGDAFVVAPDGSRAGIVWQIGDIKPSKVCGPSPSRWGVYEFGYSGQVRDTDDFVKMCHTFLPQLKALHAKFISPPERK